MGIPESRQTYCHEKGIKFFASRTFEPKLCNRNALVDSHVFYVTLFFSIQAFWLWILMGVGLPTLVRTNKNPRSRIEDK